MAGNSSTPTPARTTRARARGKREGENSGVAGSPKDKSTPSTNRTASNSAMPTPESPVYFWRPHEDHGYLGQWYVSPFTHDGTTYRTAEMWMMVSKARLFGDEEVAQLMLATDDPKEHKRLGRLVKNWDENVWKKERLNIVEEGNWLKFTQSDEAEALKERLLSTGDRELVEASPLDRIWGIGFGIAKAEQNRARWGANLLGKALMTVRNRLREDQPK